ncbi:hypothetical protein [Methylobacterium goesingense]|uniref:Uncharacterized protein n=1 Tax=Methylobacterium goesingense TaxID=243690 RepID=A0ABV2L7G3_9HYPH|nr:hypothetical protein [Methylobacterium goesingense]
MRLGRGHRPDRVFRESKVTKSTPLTLRDHQRDRGRSRGACLGPIVVGPGTAFPEHSLRLVTIEEPQEIVIGLHRHPVTLSCVSNVDFAVPTGGDVGSAESEGPAKDLGRKPE